MLWLVDNFGHGGTSNRREMAKTWLHNTDCCSAFAILVSWFALDFLCENHLVVLVPYFSLLFLFLATTFHQYETITLSYKLHICHRCLWHAFIFGSVLLQFQLFLILFSLFHMRGSPCSISSIFFTGVFDTLSSSTKLCQQNAVVSRFLRRKVFEKVSISHSTSALPAIRCRFQISEEEKELLSKYALKTICTAYVSKSISTS